MKDDELNGKVVRLIGKTEADLQCLPKHFGDTKIVKKDDNYYLTDPRFDIRDLDSNFKDQDQEAYSKAEGFIKILNDYARQRHCDNFQSVELSSSVETYKDGVQQGIVVVDNMALRRKGPAYSQDTAYIIKSLEELLKRYIQDLKHSQKQSTIVAIALSGAGLFVGFVLDHFPTMLAIILVAVYIVVSGLIVWKFIWTS